MTPPVLDAETFDDFVSNNEVAVVYLEPGIPVA